MRSPFMPNDRRGKFLPLEKQHTDLKRKNMLKIGLYSVLIAVFILIALVILALLAPKPISIIPNSTDKIGQMLVVLFFISLILERSIRVLLITWREPKELIFKQKLTRLEKHMEWINNIENSGDQDDRDRKSKNLINEHSEIRSSLEEYRLITHRNSLWFALIIGVIVSYLGFRVLEPIINVSDSYFARDIHYRALRAIDIVLTGGLIAGGSEGIRSLIESLSTFLSGARPLPPSSGRIS